MQLKVTVIISNVTVRQLLMELYHRYISKKILMLHLVISVLQPSSGIYLIAIFFISSQI